MSDSQAIYNLKVVVRETGLKPDTIRAWERRYGLPQPDRTDGGHRLYSQRDIDVLKWLITRQHEGLSISRAVDLWQSLEEAGQDPLGMVPSYSGPNEGYTPEPLGIDRLSEYRQQWITACMQFDELRAEALITEALTLFPPEMVCMELLQRGISEIGNHWYDAEATVQQEHFASGLAMRRIDALIASTPPPSRAGRIIVGCPPGEDHVFGPLMLTFLLRRQGWDVVYLGANVPVERLDETVKQTRPDLLILAAQQIPTVASLVEVAEHVQFMDIPFAFGGRLFVHLPGLIGRVRGHYLGDDIQTAVSTVRSLIVNAPQIENGVSLPAHYRKALDQFIEQRGVISAEVYNLFSGNGIDPRHIEEANLRLGMTISAALKLGDISVMEFDLAWIQGLLTRRGMSAVPILAKYLEAYGGILNQHMGDNGDLITDELSRLVEVWDDIYESEDTLN